MQDAVNYAWAKGALIVGAAGNDNTTSQFYPAALTNVLSVGATDGTDAKASFSNSGSWVKVYAPGVSVGTTVMTGAVPYATLTFAVYCAAMPANG